MNIQKSASVLEPLSIPGAFVFPLKSRSHGFSRKVGLDGLCTALLGRKGDDYFLFLNIKKKKKKGSASVTSLLFVLSRIRVAPQTSNLA